MFLIFKLCKIDGANIHSEAELRYAVCDPIMELLCETWGLTVCVELLCKTWGLMICVELLCKTWGLTICVELGCNLNELACICCLCTIYTFCFRVLINFHRFLESKRSM